MENNNEKTAVAVQKNISDKVLAKINEFQKAGALILPKDYSAENALKSAFLILSETKDSNKQLVLQSCSEASIANTLLDMVVRGLSPLKKQYYFIPYGGKLQGQPSYFGNIATAKRVSTVTDINANVIYNDDVFEYEINTETGKTKVLKHESKLDNIDFDAIRGAYAVVINADGSSYAVIMTMKQIRRSWEMGQTKGTSQAHKGFTDEMCKRTVINRACKQIINSSDDGYLFDETEKQNNNEPDSEDIIAQNANKGEEISFADEAEIISEHKEEPQHQETAAEVKPEQANGSAKPEKLF